MDYQIRRATIDDLDGIVSLWEKLSYDQMSKDEYYKGEMVFSNGKSQFQNSLTDLKCAIFVGVIDDNIIGFSEVWLHDRDFHFFADDYAYILHFYIDIAARKNKKILGIINRLYRSCEDWAILNGKKFLVADIFEHNIRAMRIVERFRMKSYRRRYVKTL